jgi:hypothetical protein
MKQEEHMSNLQVEKVKIEASDPMGDLAEIALIYQRLGLKIDATLERIRKRRGKAA